jgi:hypothetical protein
MSIEERPKTHLYESTVRKEYGLTPAMIEELGEPDRFATNPHYKSGPSARLYLISRVEAWVEANRQRVEEAKEKRAKRSAALEPSRQAKLAKRAEELRAEKAQRKQEHARIRRETQVWTDEQILQIAPLPDDLTKNVCQFFRWDRGEPTPTQYRSYVRQVLSNFNALRDSAKKQPHFDVLADVLRRRFDCEIDRVLNEWRRKWQGFTKPSPPSLDTARCHPPGSQ